MQVKNREKRHLFQASHFLKEFSLSYGTYTLYNLPIFTSSCIGDSNTNAIGIRFSVHLVGELLSPSSLTVVLNVFWIHPCLFFIR